MGGKDLRIGVLCDFYGGLLTDKQREAVRMYYDDDLSLAEIAAHTGITRQGVRDAIKRGESVLLEMEAALGLAARFEERTRSDEEIRTLAERILEQNRHGAVNTETVACATRILELTNSDEEQ